MKYQGLLFPFVLEQNKERNTCTRTTVMEVRGKRQKHFKLLMFTLNGHLFEPQGFRYHKQTCHFKQETIKGSTKNVLSHLRDQSDREGGAGVVYITAEPQLHDHCN